MSNAQDLLVHISVYDDDMPMVLDDDIRHFHQESTTLVWEVLNRHTHVIGEVRIVNYMDCPVCGEQVEKFGGLPYAKCRLPEGCGHMFCCDCLVDYLPVMREGNHQHRDGCRHYEPLDHIDMLPAYVVPVVYDHHGDQLQVVHHQRTREWGALFEEEMVVPEPVSKVKTWLKRVSWMIFIWFILKVALILLIALSCGYHRPEPRARFALLAPCAGFPN